MSPTSESSSVPSAKLTAKSRRMSQLPGLGDCFVAPHQCLLGITETEKDNPHLRLCVYIWAMCGVMDQRAVGDRIIKHKSFFQMRS